MLKKTAAVVTTSLAGGFVAFGQAQTTSDRPSSLEQGRRSNPIAFSSYSYWRYNDDTKLPIEKCIELAADAGFDGFEILHVQMQDDSPS